MEYNPIKESESGGTIPAGSYIAVLEAVDPKKRKVFEGNGAEEDCLRFKFVVEHKGVKASVFKSVRPFNSSKSALVLLLKALDPSLDELTRVNRDKLWVFTKAQIGKKFLVNVEPKGEFNNLMSVMPPPVLEVAPKPLDQSQFCQDDDIPF